MGKVENAGSAAADMADKVSDAVAGAAGAVASKTPTDIDDKIVEQAHEMNPLNKPDGTPKA